MIDSSLVHYYEYENQMLVLYSCKEMAIIDIGIFLKKHSALDLLHVKFVYASNFVCVYIYSILSNYCLKNIVSIEALH